jgi:NADH dehydrogenase/NADH:ubiquinone oxidoreductase subunit G
MMQGSFMGVCLDRVKDLTAIAHARTLTVKPWFSGNCLEYCPTGAKETAKKRAKFLFNVLIK